MPNRDKEVLVVYQGWTEKIANFLAYEISCQDGLIGLKRNINWGYNPLFYRAVVVLVDGKADWVKSGNVLKFDPIPFQEKPDSPVKRMKSSFYEKQAQDFAENVINWLD